MQSLHGFLGEIPYILLGSLALQGLGHVDWPMPDGSRLAQLAFFTHHIENAILWQLMDLELHPAQGEWASIEEQHNIASAAYACFPHDLRFPKETEVTILSPPPTPYPQ